MQKKIKESEMKTLRIKYLMTVFLLLVYTSSNSQSDTNKIYYTNDISIYYDEGLKEAVSYSTGKKTFVNSNLTILNISKLRILEDSLIRVTSNSSSSIQLNINNISGVSIKSGSSTGWGIGLGLLLGICAGAGIGAAVESSRIPEDAKSSGFGAAFGGLIGIPVGILFGGIIGSNITGYETYELGNNNYEKKKELMRILDKDCRFKDD